MAPESPNASLDEQAKALLNEFPNTAHGYACRISLCPQRELVEALRANGAQLRTIQRIFKEKFDYRLTEGQLGHHFRGYCSCRKK